MDAGLTSQKRPKRGFQESFLCRREVCEVFARMKKYIFTRVVLYESNMKIHQEKCFVIYHRKAAQSGVGTNSATAAGDWAFSPSGGAFSKPRRPLFPALPVTSSEYQAALRSLCSRAVPWRGNGCVLLGGGEEAAKWVARTTVKKGRRSRECLVSPLGLISGGGASSSTDLVHFRIMSLSSFFPRFQRFLIGCCGSSLFMYIALVFVHPCIPVNLRSFAHPALVRSSRSPSSPVLSNSLEPLLVYRLHTY